MICFVFLILVALPVVLAARGIKRWWDVAASYTKAELSAKLMMITPQAFALYKALQLSYLARVFRQSQQNSKGDAKMDYMENILRFIFFDIDVVADTFRFDCFLGFRASRWFQSLLSPFWPLLLAAVIALLIRMLQRSEHGRVVNMVQYAVLLMDMTLVTAMTRISTNTVCLHVVNAASKDGRLLALSFETCDGTGAITLHIVSTAAGVLLLSSLFGTRAFLGGRYRRLITLLATQRLKEKPRIEVTQNDAAELVVRVTASGCIEEEPSTSMQRIAGTLQTDGSASAANSLTCREALVTGQAAAVYAALSQKLRSTGCGKPALALTWTADGDNPDFVNRHCIVIAPEYRAQVCFGAKFAAGVYIDAGHGSSSLRRSLQMAQSYVTPLLGTSTQWGTGGDASSGLGSRVNVLAVPAHKSEGEDHPRDVSALLQLCKGHQVESAAELMQLHALANAWHRRREHSRIVGLKFHQVKPSHLWLPQILQLVSTSLVGAASGAEPSQNLFALIAVTALLSLVSEPHVLATTSHGAAVTLMSALCAVYGGVTCGVVFATLFHAAFALTILCGPSRLQAQVASYNLANALARMEQLQKGQTLTQEEDEEASSQRVELARLPT